MDKEIKESLDKLYELDAKASQEFRKYKKILPTEIIELSDKIDQLEYKLYNLESLFFNDFLYFFNSQFSNYESLELLFYLHPETRDINYYFMDILRDIFNKPAPNNPQKRYADVIDDLTSQDLPSIEEILDKINTKIANDKVGRESFKILKPINKHNLLKLLYLYTKDAIYKETIYCTQVEKILQVNNISFGSPNCFAWDNTKT